MLGFLKLLVIEFPSMMDKKMVMFGFLKIPTVLKLIDVEFPSAVGKTVAVDPVNNDPHEIIIEIPKRKSCRNTSPNHNYMNIGRTSKHAKKKW